MPPFLCAKGERIVRVVVAPDSFKGTLTATQAAQAMARGILRVWGNAEVDCRPMADGGEGSLDAVLSAVGGERVEVTACDPNGRRCQSSYARLANGRAVVELAQASGLPLVPESVRTPQRGLAASTYGTGLLLRHALHHGALSLSLTLGGSATTDGGYGLLAALGARYLDAAGCALSGMDATELAAVASIHLPTQLLEQLRGISIDIACDVTNPLCGPAGAAAIYGPQKGLDGAAIASRDSELRRWVELLHRAWQESAGEPAGESAVELRDIAELPGIGAAGGAALPLFCLGQAKLVPGAGMVADAIGLEAAIGDADIVITGEGRSDGQSALGKVPAHVGELARRHHLPCILLSGALAPGHEALFDRGVTAAFAASPAGASVAEIGTNAATWLEAAAAQVAKSWTSV